jgi:VanZ family protein
MRSLETIDAMRFPFPVIPSLVAHGLRYLDSEFENAAGLAMMLTRHPMWKSGAIALVLVMWVAALASQLSLFGAERGHPTPADLIAMTIGALMAMFADVARAPAHRRHAI